MTKRIPYKNFPNFVLRTPLFSFDFYKNITSKENISDEMLKSLCQNSVVKEALFLASPELYSEIIKWVTNEMVDKDKIEKLKYSILKYISRMSSRCTPFGLFAGCGVGTFSERTNIELKKTIENKRHTRLDMNFLVELSQDLIKIDKIRQQILFFPNSSIYPVGNQLRYVEYNYFNGRRKHHIAAIDNNEYLGKIFKAANDGECLTNLSDLLVDDEISLEEATNFINELVDNQLLISDLEPSVSGPEFLEQICSVLKTINGVEDILSILLEVNNDIINIDQTIGNDPQLYINIYYKLKRFNEEYELRHMFQTDLVLNTKKNTLDTSIIKSIQKGITLLNRITLPRKNSLLDKFKDSFIERYNEREVPLSMALDVEVGLGYIQDNGFGDVCPLLDELIIPEKKSQDQIRNIKWSTIDMLLQHKLIKALKNDDYKIVLNDKEFENHEVNWKDLSDTFSCMIQLVEIDGQQKIKFNDLGGSSAGNLLGRFCHVDKNIYEHTKNIVDVETQINERKILAEIVHLPESRVGNILMRPALREYEIPYLSKSIKPKKNRLSIDDLVISVKGNKKIQLRSKKENKEVIPHLTNAHNFSQNALPIYNFLCDMQTQGMRHGLGFYWGPFADEYEFLPRVEYDNIILKEASWNLTKNHIDNLVNNIKDDVLLVKAIRIFQKKMKIPQFVLLTDGDNQLIINLLNLDSVRMLLSTVKNRSKFILKEFLFTEGSEVKHKKDYFTNQFIVSFYNEDKLNERSDTYD